MKTDFPMVDVLQAAAETGHRLRLRFSDGSEGVYDLSAYVAQGGEMDEPLKSPGDLARVLVEFGAPTWPNGFDLDPVYLYIELREAGALKRAVPVG